MTHAKRSPHAAPKSEQDALLALVAHRGESIGPKLAKSAKTLHTFRTKRFEAARAAGAVSIVSSRDDLNKPLQSGFVLICPPLVGIDARGLREIATEQGVDVIIIAREPLTQTNRCPVVTLGPETLRTQIDPPANMMSPTSDWFMAAASACTQEAITMIEGRKFNEPSDRVAMLIDLIASHPESTDLLDVLLAACEAPTE